MIDLAQQSPASRRGGLRARHAAPEAPIERRGLRSLRNPLPPVELVDHEGIDRIIAAAFALLQEAGIEFHNEGARGILHKNGAAVDDTTVLVRMDEGLVREFVANAPESFRMHARNPAHDISIGGPHINITPVGGPPNASDRGQRPGIFGDQQNLIRLDQALGITQLAGAAAVEDQDLLVEKPLQ